MLRATSVAGLVLLGTSAAWAGKTEPVEVRVVIEDAATGAPVGVASVRHPGEAELHPVNSVDGSWTGNALYLPDGEEVLFLPGSSLTFEVSAPGYITREFTYEVRKRRNIATIQITAAPEIEIEDPDEIVTGFGGDKPLDK